MPKTETRTITPSELDAVRQSGETVVLIDVRTPAEFRSVHVSGARNVPLTDLEPGEFAASDGTGESGPIHVICKSGARAGKACEQLAAAGCENVVTVSGGTDTWVEAGLAVVRGKQTISLERQVRIAAGLIVLAGSVLALTVHPYFAGIPTFVGAGLTFAGITDTCGMGMLLARMPWNCRA